MGVDAYDKCTQWVSPYARTVSLEKYHIMDPYVPHWKVSHSNRYPHGRGPL